MTPQIIVGGIHLVNTTAQSPGGSPTAAASTPFAIRPGWTMAGAAPVPILSGGPPFRWGAALIDLGYDTVMQHIPINVIGSSHENAVALIQQLRLALNTTLYSTAPLLAIQPTPSSAVMYSEILYAEVREVTEPDTGFEPWEAKDSEINAEITLAHKPFFNPASMTTLINGATFKNTGTGSNNNTQSLGALIGDMVYEGQPLNLKIIPATGLSIRTVILATVYQRTFTTGTTPVATTTAAVAFRDTTSGILNPAQARNGLRARVLFRVSAMSVKAQLQVQLIARQSSYLIWRGPLIQPGGSIGTQIDLTPQGVPLDAIRRAGLTTGDVDVGVAMFSPDATSVTVTPASLETLLYYTYCQVLSGSPIISLPQYLKIEQAQNLNGTAYAPTPGTAYLVDLNGGNEYLALQCDVRGTLPLAISGASLYVALLGIGGGHQSTDSAAVTVTHLPLWHSFRGA